VIRIHIKWEKRPSQPAAESLRKLAAGCLNRLDRADSEVHLLVTDDERIRDLNRRFRDIDSPTDVLSFPDGDLMPSGMILLGEVVVSLETARRQAEELGHSEIRELSELVLHGILHLLGYDHEKDGGEMDDLELRLGGDLLW
jgi:probable rRNA maturation factor